MCAQEKETTCKRLAAFKTYSLRLYNYAEKYKQLSKAIIAFHEGNFNNKKIGNKIHKPNLACYHEHPNAPGEFYVKYFPVESNGEDEKHSEEDHHDKDNSDDQEHFDTEKKKLQELLSHYYSKLTSDDLNEDQNEISDNEWYQEKQKELGQKEFVSNYILNPVKSIMKNKQKSNNYTTLQFAIALMMAILSVASCETIQTKRFIYSDEGHTRINPKFVFTKSDYIPCDIMANTWAMEQLVSELNRTCRADFLKHTLYNLYQRNVIEDNIGEYVLLTAIVNPKAGEEWCNRIGATLVEVRNAHSHNTVAKLMGNHKNIGQVPANIYRDPSINQYLFRSDKSQAMDRAFNRIYYKDETKNWNDAVKYTWKDFDYYYPEQSWSFFYVKMQSGDITLVAAEPNYDSRTSNIICKLDNINDDILYAQFQADCKEKTIRMNEQLQKSASNMNSILPFKLKSDPINPSITNKMEADVSEESILIEKMKKAGEQVRSLNKNEFTLRKICMNHLKKEEKSLVKRNVQKILEQNEEHGIEKRSVAGILSWGAVTLGTLIQTLGVFFSFYSFANLFIPRGNAFDEKFIYGDGENIIVNAQKLIENFNPPSRKSSYSSSTFVPSSYRNMTRISSTFDLIYNYNKDAINYLRDIYIFHIDLPASSTISDKDMKTIQQFFRHNNDVDIMDSLSLVQAFRFHSTSSYTTMLKFPIDKDEDIGKLISLVPQPEFMDSKRIMPIMEHRHYFIKQSSEHFALLTDEEFKDCKTHKICNTNSPFFPRQKATCEIETFYNNGSTPNTCKEIINENLDPYFTILGHNLYYSLNDQIQITMHCTHESNVKNDLSTTSHTLSGQGVITINDHCYASYMNIMLYPSTPMSYINDLAIKSNGSEQLNGFNIESTLEDHFKGLVKIGHGFADIYKFLEYLAPAAIVFAIFIGIFIIICICGKYVFRCKTLLCCGKTKTTKKQKNGRIIKSDYYKVKPIELNEITVLSENDSKLDNSTNSSISLANVKMTSFTNNNNILPMPPTDEEIYVPSSTTSSDYIEPQQQLAIVNEPQVMPLKRICEKPLTPPVPTKRKTIKDK